MWTNYKHLGGMVVANKRKLTMDLTVVYFLNLAMILLAQLS